MKISDHFLSEDRLYLFSLLDLSVYNVEKIGNSDNVMAITSEGRIRYKNAGEENFKRVFFPKKNVQTVFIS